MLTKEISEVEKEINEFEARHIKDGCLIESECVGELLIKILKILSTLKSAQQKFDKFVEDLKLRIAEKHWDDDKETAKLWRIIDELSSKQEEKC